MVRNKRNRSSFRATAAGTTPQTFNDGRRVAGRIPVKECLEAGKRKPRHLWLQEGLKGVEPVRALLPPETPVTLLKRQDLDTLAGCPVHQGIVLDADPLPILALETWIARQTEENTVMVALDNIADPHNFGAIIRSAAACGAAGVLFGKHRAAPLSPVALKSAAGAAEHIDLVQATNLSQDLQQLQKNGFWIAALDAEAPETIWEAPLEGKIVLVVCSEGKGIRPLVRKQCDFAMRIPLQGAITSLNASVSAGIALAECLRRRTPGEASS